MHINERTCSPGTTNVYNTYPMGILTITKSLPALMHFWPFGGGGGHQQSDRGAKFWWQLPLVVQEK